MKIVYYAHPMTLYGTQQELYDISALADDPSALVINPNSPIFEREVKAVKDNRRIMDIFTDYIIDNADVVAFRSFADGHVGSGVAQEVFTGFIYGKEIWQVVDSTNSTRVLKGVTPDFNKMLTVSETKRRVHGGSK